MDAAKDKSPVELEPGTVIEIKGVPHKYLGHYKGQMVFERVGVPKLRQQVARNIVRQKHGEQYEKGAAPLVKLNRCGRNESCPCGSGRKYKKCCIDKRS